MVFIDKRFTIPNYPSRILSYLKLLLPVFIETHQHTDLGMITQENDFGLWSESGDLDSLVANISFISSASEGRKRMGVNGRRVLFD